MDRETIEAAKASDLTKKVMIVSYEHLFDLGNRRDSEHHAREELEQRRLSIRPRVRDEVAGTSSGTAWSRRGSPSRSGGDNLFPGKRANLNATSGRQSKDIFVQEKVRTNFVCLNYHCDFNKEAVSREKVSDARDG